MPRNSELALVIAANSRVTTIDSQPKIEGLDLVACAETRGIFFNCKLTSMIP